MADPDNAVDSYMQQLEHSQKPAIEALRAIIKGAGMDVTERIKWNAPSYAYNGDDRITFRLQPGNRLQLIFHRGAKVKDSQGFSFTDETGLLEWAAPDRGVVSFRDLDDVTARQAALENLVRLWLNAAG